MSDPNCKATLCEIDPQHEIRILRLWPGIFGSSLRGTLRVQVLSSKSPDVGSSSRSTGYEALSYTWGSWEDSKSIRIDDKYDIQISQNLWTALQNLRGNWRWQDFWVDQICIDQESHYERNHQVKLMGEVYRQADQVLVWLGASKPQSNGFEEWVSWLGGTPTPTMLARLVEDALRGQEPRWHSRGWVVQEVLLATNQPLVCVGRFRLQIADIARGFLFPEWNSVCQILDKHGNELSAPRDFFYFAQLIKNTETSDPRDKIYSLLSLLSDGTSQLISPDYGASVASVYAQATVSYLITHETMSFIALADRSYSELASEVASSITGILPSWVVNFSSLLLHRTDFVRHPEFSIRPRSWCRLSPRCTPALVHEFGTKTLGVLGLDFDKIVWEIGLTRTSELKPQTHQKALRLLEGFLHPDLKAGLSGAEPFRPHPYSSLQDRASTSQPTPSWGPVLRFRPPVAGDFCEGFSLPQLLREWHDLCDPLPDTSVESIESMLRSRLQFWHQYLDPPERGRTPRLYLTASGFLGLGPRKLRCGDQIALLYGSTVPMILREEEDGTYKFLGFTYVHGIMQSELMRYPDLELEERTFVLS